MSKMQSFSNKIILINVIGMSILLVALLSAFHIGILAAENAVIERRISMVAPHHLDHVYNMTGAVEVDPLLTLYGSRDALPHYMLSKIPVDWTGTMQILMEDEQEYQVIGKLIENGDEGKIVYAIENSDSVEWDDTAFFMTEIILAIFGIGIFIITISFTVNASKRVAMPFLSIAHELQSDLLDHFENIRTDGVNSIESAKIMNAINSYRHRIANLLKREKSFTRYISHELRTPMMVIQGSLNVIKQNQGQCSEKSLERIENANKQMKQLTSTFLYLVRDESDPCDKTMIDQKYLSQLKKELQEFEESNLVSFSMMLQHEVYVRANTLLLSAVIKNLLINAFGCSVNGEVSLTIDERSIQV
ncbi:MAG: HAMP domain-containing sensor histidine kinase, partial [Pseudomonadota bacterium]